jgi:RNA polymerase sigma-70 factor (ECF subfamily)
LLAARAAQGEPGAFAELVRRHERAVRAFLMRLTRSPVLADDLAQEAFLTAWRKAQAYDGRGRYLGWLFGLAWTAFLMDARRGRRERAVLAAAPAPGSAATADPEGALALDQALSALEPQERAALLLCLGHGLSHAEAAAALGVPLGTLKSRVARARDRLARLLTEPA